MALELGETFTSGVFKIKDTAGAPGAANLTVSVLLPSGAVDSPAIVNPSLGSYYFDYLTTATGRCPYIVTATGGALGSLVKKFTDVIVVGEATTNAIVSLADAKNHLGLPLSETAQDDELDMMIRGATSKIEQRCGPVVIRTVTNERHPGGGRAVWLREPPGPHGDPTITIVSATSVADGTTITPSDLSADPSGRVAYSSGLRFARGDWYWTYTTGRNRPPSGLREAALNFVRDSWTVKRGPSGLPWAGAQDQAVEVPGMGLVLWRLEQDMKPYLLPPAGA